MHVKTSVLHLATVISLFPFLGLSAAPHEIVVGTTATALKPINIHDFEAATGVRRRAADDFSHLDPNIQAQLIYGRPGNDGQLLLANMTLYAPDGLQIVMMERFEPLTSAVDCKGDDGEMSLTFKSKEIFEHAIKTWDFINKAKDERFLLIANHDGCGPDDERQPYLITGIRDDAATLTTYLTAQPAAWSDVAGTYDLDFGRAAMPRPGPQRRGLFDFLGDASDFLLHGDIDLDKSANFPTVLGTPGQNHSIINIPKFSLACTDCYITGSFQAIGRLSVSGFKLQDFTLAASPQDFVAKLQLETTITAPLGSPDSLQHTTELFKAPIPNAGIVVPRIFSLGAIVSYEVGVSTSFSGTASMTFGLTASMPNTAAVVADIRHPSQSSATGFNGSVFDPNFDLQALTASVTVAAYAQPKLSFEVDITKVGHLGIALGVKSPVISATLTGGYNESGLCSNEPGASKTGVKLSSEVALQVNLELSAQLGEDDNDPAASTPPPPTDPKPAAADDDTPASADSETESSIPDVGSLSFNLFKLSHPLLAKCFPLNLPGFSPVTGYNATAANATTTLTPPPFVNGTVTGTGTSIAVATSALETLVPVSTVVTTSAAAASTSAVVGVVGVGRRVVRGGRY
ncbi:MAG: hypothetical protein LQ339_005911 [Xanthoria mediterranea]|nr:MAG: hypothetical protein LQ339_005911 [Xanthoria mediterranea]